MGAPADTMTPDRMIGISLLQRKLSKSLRDGGHHPLGGDGSILTLNTGPVSQDVYSCGVPTYAGALNPAVPSPIRPRTVGRAGGRGGGGEIL